MTDAQWELLLRLVRGESVEPLPVGFIIDSPWLPNWAGMSILDYYTDDQLWMQANLKAIEQFPEVMFLPGFWSEYGMCTEPSAFGAKCVWPEDEFPFAKKVLDDFDDIARLEKPKCATDGLPPFVLKRLVHRRGDIEKAGHKIRFAVARGPLNVASYLLGHTELLVGVKTNPDEVHRLLAIVTEFLVDWLRLQIDSIDSIDAVLTLDDLVGFLGDDDFQQFALPYLKQIYDACDVSVKAFHNDAHGLITAKYLEPIGINVFNFAFEHPIAEIRKLAGQSVVMLGNLPPRDVLAQGSPDDVRRGVAEMLAPIEDRRRILCSCGGGMPPGVPTENIAAFCEAVKAAG
jgi:uroporphyrinogen decarboxylase